MARRVAWHGAPPEDAEDARRRLLETTREVIEARGLERATLGEVAERAGVTRQTVYRYFESVDALFLSAAAVSSGGMMERVLEEAARLPTWPERIVESLAFATVAIPQDPYLAPLFEDANLLSPSDLVETDFTRQGMIALADGALPISEEALDELVELSVRLLHSYLRDPGPVPRDRAGLRAFYGRWLLPALKAQMG